MVWYVRSEDFECDEEESMRIVSSVESLDTNITYGDIDKEHHRILTFFKTRDENKNYVIRLEYPRNFLKYTIRGFFPSKELRDSIFESIGKIITNERALKV